MTEHAATIETQYKDFIQRIVETNEVWGLTKDDTWATSSSSEFEDTEVILFWSDKGGATACSEDEWESYTPESITLVEFLENWCVGMYGDELLVGANWDKNLVGKEAEPLVVALDVVTQLKAQGKTLEFTQYDSQQEFEEQVTEALESE
ncbi:DUF2750 domain-containing protein [Pontibacter akesuensis]|uniref:DUF2750 domain-containing protein n=1 Tax=Pontibacter akesuensis TaxID=388950 RepID=A0A1I7FXN4_9BACT|nr:DUF2750 domain-containing protein [Pontibacter akesuensis]GHA59987.1 hypothetical protein GCM10007389_10180 [Pontibacter akesuensis]SFU40935.1 Protein of unknown function [Pontibacter akesuensis]